ncbi:MAG: right-handed parallel beta-helix repeat-containing protein [Pseudomonadota bacterium]
MTFRLSGPYSYFTDGNGAPLANGMVFFYEAGTSQPRDTWDDSVKSAVNTNPVILDAEGKARIALDGTYKIVVQDALGAEIWTADNVATPPTATDVDAAVQAALSVPTYPTTTQAANQTISAATLVLQTAGFASADDGGGAQYRRVTAQPSHALRFRTVDRFLPDGTENTANGGWWEIDTQVIDARMAGYKADNLPASASGNASALANIQGLVLSRGGGVLIIPPGVAQINAAWHLGSTGALEIIGNGATLDFSTATGASGITISTGSNIVIQGLRIQDAPGNAVYVSGAANGLRFINCTFVNSGNEGARVDAGQRIAFINCASQNNAANGFHFVGNSKHEQIYFENCRSFSNGGSGARMNNIESLRITDFVADGNSGQGLYVFNVRSAVVSNPVLTSNTGAGIRLDVTNASNTAFDVDNTKIAINGGYAEGNLTSAMFLQVFTSGAGLIEADVSSCQDVGATVSVSVTGAGETITGSANSFSGGGPESANLAAPPDYHSEVLLAESDFVSASQIDLVLVGSYDSYVIDVINLRVVTATETLWMRFRTTGGAVRAAGADYTDVFTSSSGNGGQTGGAIRLTGGTPVSEAASDGVSGKIEVFVPGDASKVTRIRGQLLSVNTAGSSFVIDLGGLVTTAESNDLVRLLASSGNVSGKVRLLGRRAKA